MAPRPYSDRAVLPRDSSNSSMSIDSDSGQMTVDTSNGSAATTPSPVDQDGLIDVVNTPEVMDEELEVPPHTTFYPTPADTMPFDHAFPDFIRQLTNERNLANVQSLRLRVISSLVSLQRMSMFTMNLRELDLEGSILGSLRDIGCNLKCLHVLKVGNCQLDSLDGTFGLTSLRKLYAQKNQITDVTPCSNLPHIQHIDLSSNRIRNISYAGFLSVCRKLKSVVFAGNPAAQLPDYRAHVKRLLPQLKSLDDVVFGDEDALIDHTADQDRGEEEDTADGDEDEQYIYDGNEEVDFRLESGNHRKERLDVNENYDSEVQEILKHDRSRVLTGRETSLLSLRKERDDKQFLGVRQRQSFNIDYEETEDLAENCHASGASLGKGDGLSLPPLSISDRETRRILNVEKDSFNSSPSVRGDKRTGRLRGQLVSSPDLEAGTSSEHDSDLGQSRNLSKLERPSTANNSILTRSKFTNVAEDQERKRPCTAGSMPASYDQANEENMVRKSLTSGLPICGNLAVAMRNRKRLEQEREELELLRAKESESSQ